MKTEKLTAEELGGLIDRIHDNPKLDVLFNRLFAIYGAPRWLAEKKPFQDPEFLVSEWENVVKDYDEADIMEAANRLFKFRKLQTFPTAAHILAELPEDTKTIKPEPVKKPYAKPAELVEVWQRAKVFAVSLELYSTTDKETQAEGMKIRQQMTIGGWLECQRLAKDAMRDYFANDPRMHELYDDDSSRIAAAYKAGVFADVIAKIRANIDREWDMPLPEKKTDKRRDYLAMLGLKVDG